MGVTDLGVPFVGFWLLEEGVLALFRFAFEGSVVVEAGVEEIAETEDGVWGGDGWEEEEEEEGTFELVGAVVEEEEEEEGVVGGENSFA